MRLKISSPPHLRSSVSARQLMLNVILALLPVVFASIYFYRKEAVYLIFICCGVAVLTEEAICRIRKKSSSLKDFSALLTGLLMALILPPQIKWYAAAMGSAFAVFIGKHIYGGLGFNIFNPALIGRAFLMAAYPKMLTTFAEPLSADAVTSATPLALHKFSGVLTPLKDLFLGNVSGSLGETSAVCIIIGGLYLFMRKIADWRTPLALLASVVLIAGIVYKIDPSKGAVLFHLFSGGLMLGVFFMATDPVTTPVTRSGRFIFGAGCGILIMIIRYFSGLPEGVMYSILFFNSLTPLINRYTRHKPFGSR